MEEIQLKYAGFWQRFGAVIIDFLIMMPFTAFTFWGMKYYHFMGIYFVPSMLIGAWYQIWLVYKYGGTPGKLLVKTKVCKLDGSPVDLRSAIIRHAPMFVMAHLQTVAMIIAIYGMSQEEYYAIDGFVNISVELTKRAPSWFQPLSTSLQIWVWSEIFVILFNKKRRAIHDYIAGTVVVRTSDKSTATSDLPQIG